MSKIVGRELGFTESILVIKSLKGFEYMLFIGGYEPLKILTAKPFID
jgi:hypothetical protein